jgi:hypothetical protein
VQSALVGAGGLVVELLFSLSFFFFFLWDTNGQNSLHGKGKENKKRQATQTQIPLLVGVGNCLV